MIVKILAIAALTLVGFHAALSVGVRGLITSPATRWSWLAYWTVVIFLGLVILGVVR